MNFVTNCSELLQLVAGPCNLDPQRNSTFRKAWPATLGCEVVRVIKHYFSQIFPDQRVAEHICPADRETLN